MRNLVTAAALFCCLLLAASQDSSIRDAFAAELPVPPRGEVSMQGYGDKNKLCQEWTDGCRTCTRLESGDPVCSNPGIACQPKAISCSRRAEEKKEEKK